MNNVFIESNTTRKIITVHLENQQTKELTITELNGKPVSAPIISHSSLADGKCKLTINAENLSMWTPDNPVLYILNINGQKVRFGFNDITTRSDKIFVNGSPFYFRGYIRGIVAHEHSNLSGKSTREFYRKNILQAKKYGFNLVRFHSTVPDAEFIGAADELGLFVHIEIGFSYQFDTEGNKQGIALDEERWRDVITKFRNNPSVAIFCLGNEMHNSGSVPEVHDMYCIGRKLVPHKLIVDNTGWGEFDRASADAFVQHVAYYFPFKHHQEMFNQDFCWEMNGSMHKYPLTEEKELPNGKLSVKRQLNPIQPTLAHECVHYIDIPDYTALNDEFDAFCQEVGEDYLRRNNITKPRYMTELPELIAAKGLTSKLPDYIEASRRFKKLGMKTYFERLRLSDKYCGYEMLQFADCFKYENKNGIVDIFDNDKYIDAEWFRSFNSDRVILADFPKENFYSMEEFKVDIHLSNYCFNENEFCNLRVFLNEKGKDGKLAYSGEKLLPVEELSKLAELKLQLKCENGKATAYTLKVELNNSCQCWSNEWMFTVYPAVDLKQKPEMKIVKNEVKNFLNSKGANAENASDLVFTDILNDEVFSDLEAGKTVILNYHRNSDADQYYFPGTLDRFKPCIWDRGSNLGGVVTSNFLQETMGGGRYFDLNYYYLVEAGYKVNLDHFPVPVNEVIWGVDKPVRDRMKPLNQGIKDFLPDDTLRNFSYLFSVKAGKGVLIVCSFNFASADSDPATANMLCALMNNYSKFDTDCSIQIAELKAYLEKSTKAGIIREDVMNHFWEIDNKPVEDTLFWEQAQVDLRNIE